MNTLDIAQSFNGILANLLCNGGAQMCDDGHRSGHRIEIRQALSAATESDLGKVGKARTNLVR